MKQTLVTINIFILAVFGLMSCSGSNGAGSGGPDAQGHTAPTAATVNANKKLLSELPFSDKQDFKDAKRGFIAAEKDLRIKNARGEYVWNMTEYDFIKGKAPESVNPSLWRQETLNNIHGLFKVTDGIYQLRGFDLANISIIEGKTGWIIVDPLTSKQTAIRAISFARKHLGDKPIVAIIFTHTHVDHFGGSAGLMRAEKKRGQKVRIIVPQGFMEEATSENIIAGIAMQRRAHYQFGKRLARNKRGHVGSGLGKSPAYGDVGILKPTDIIKGTPQKLEIDGVNFEFQFTPGAEAPAELTFYLPKQKAFCGAEVVSHNMHNIYTIRGARVRDAHKWAYFINEALEIFGTKSDVYFGSHHWPVWGRERIVDFLKKQRDTYKYIHDQTIRLANNGFTSREISEKLKLPEAMHKSFANRGYYGTLSHNSKAVYQQYFGWYDANPANLNPLPPEESGKRYVDMMGGAANVMKKSQEYFNKGDYRFVAQVLNHLVFSDPDNKDAKELLAKTYDQMGYQSESGVWRDAYLTAAYELRHGGPKKSLVLADAVDLLRETPVARFFDSMAVRLNSDKAEGKNLTVNIVFTDVNKSFVLHVENSVLHTKERPADPKANATLKLTHKFFVKMVTGQSKPRDMIFSKDVSIQGSKIDLVRFFTMFDKPKGIFNIVTP